jgi:hypothetical protein
MPEGWCLVLLFLALPSMARAQDISTGAFGLVSFQPVDDSYVGSPYLSQGIGGIAAGLGLTFNVVTARGLVVGAEFSSAWFETEQQGRLVPGACRPRSTPGCLSVGGAGTTRLHDPLLSALIGYETGGGRSRAQFVIGVATILASPTVDTRAGDRVVVDGDRGTLALALTGGVDLVRTLSPRISLAIGARYTYVNRVESQEFLGIGPHVLRGTGGVRFTLN